MMSLLAYMSSSSIFVIWVVTIQHSSFPGWLLSSNYARHFYCHCVVVFLQYSPNILSRCCCCYHQHAICVCLGHIDGCSLLLVAQFTPVQTPFFSAGADHRSCSSTEDVLWDGKWDVVSQGLWQLCGQHQCIRAKVNLSVFSIALLKIIDLSEKCARSELCGKSGHLKKCKKSLRHYHFKSNFDEIW